MHIYITEDATFRAIKNDKQSGVTAWGKKLQESWFALL